MSKNTAQIILDNLTKPSHWIDGPYIAHLKNELEKYFEADVYPVNSGRSAIYLLLKAYEIGEEDEVLIQAYTCNAVPNPILWAGAKPIYVDIEETTLNIDPAKIDEKITKNTKAIIVQHTFGRAAKIDEIVKIAQKHKLIVIEDCAHALGAKLEGKILGKFGQAAIISFGREKVISSLSGGAIILNDKSKTEELGKLIAFTPELSSRQILKELNNYFTWRILLRRIFFRKEGELILNFLNKQDIFNVVTSQKELVGEHPSWYPAKIPNLFAQIALSQIPEIERLNEERSRVAEIYFEKVTNKAFELLPKHDGIYLRFVALHPEAKLILERARKERLWFGNWYDSPVYPGRVQLERLGYDLGSCPVAEQISSQTVNLPLHLGMKDSEIKEVLEFVNNYGS